MTTDTGGYLRNSHIFRARCFTDELALKLLSRDCFDDSEFLASYGHGGGTAYLAAFETVKALCDREQLYVLFAFDHSLDPGEVHDSEAFLAQPGSIYERLLRMAASAVVYRMRELYTNRRNYAHDCPHCRYLGQMKRHDGGGSKIRGRGGVVVDLYTCRSHFGSTELALTVRYGDNPGDVYLGNGINWEDETHTCEAVDREHSTRGR